MCDRTGEKIIEGLKNDYDMFFSMSENETYPISERFFLFETSKYIAQIIERYDSTFRRKRW